jgi:hypothetical protein
MGTLTTQDRNVYFTFIVFINLPYFLAFCYSQNWMGVLWIEFIESVKNLSDLIVSTSADDDRNALESSDAPEGWS